MGSLVSSFMSSEKDPSTLQKLCGTFHPNSHVLLLIKRLTKSKLHDFKVYKHFILFSQANIPLKIKFLSNGQT